MQHAGERRQHDRTSLAGRLEGLAHALDGASARAWAAHYRAAADERGSAAAAHEHAWTHIRRLLVEADALAFALSLPSGESAHHG